jgi:hypothetical protein
MAASVGGIFRIASHQPIHPYARANVGMVVSHQSFLRTFGSDTINTGESRDVALFLDPKSTSVSPYLSLGGGVVVTLARGYQLRTELRDNWVRLPAISGPTTRPGLEPPSRRIGKHVLSFIIAFDVILERKRGRRY